MEAPDEIAYLEQVLTGHAKPNLSPLATLGRLAQLYLLTPDNPKSLERANQLAWLMFARAEELRRALPKAALNAPAAAALRAAAADETPYAHPWYWAGFFLAGA